jgi:hypothetical protein
VSFKYISILIITISTLFYRKTTKRKKSKDAKRNSIAVADDTDDYHKWDNESYVKGFAAVIKLNPLFAEGNLVTALESNLGLEVKVFSTEDDHSKIEDSVTQSMCSITEKINNLMQILLYFAVYNMSASSAFLIVMIVGKLVTKISGKNVKEVCLDTKSKTIPISEVMRRFVGTNNTHLIGKPKFFFFIDDDNQTKKVYLPPQVYSTFLYADSYSLLTVPPLMLSAYM